MNEKVGKSDFLLGSSTPRKIMMTADAVGGIWRYALDLSRELSNYHAQVHLLVMGFPPDREQYNEASELANLILYYGNFKLEWMDNPWEDIDAASLWMLSLAEKIKPDLIHLNHFCFGNLPWKVPIIMIVHSCVYSWWRAVHGESPPVQYAEYFRRVKAGLKQVDSLIAPSQAMARSIQEIYLPGACIDIIPNSTYVADFPEYAKENRIVTIGRLWDKAKNISLVQRVAQETRWPIVAIGDQNIGEQQPKPDPFLIYTGRLAPEKVRSLLARSAIYVHPALYEPFGLSVLEAAQAGCALVLSDIESLRENWADAALFVRIDDNGEELRCMLDLLIRSPETLRQYQQNAKTRAASFSIQQTTQMYWQTYSKYW